MTVTSGCVDCGAARQGRSPRCEACRRDHYNAYIRDWNRNSPRGRKKQPRRRYQCQACGVLFPAHAQRGWSTFWCDACEPLYRVPIDRMVEHHRAMAGDWIAPDVGAGYQRGTRLGSYPFAVRTIDDGYLDLLGALSRKEPFDEAEDVWELDGTVDEAAPEPRPEVLRNRIVLERVAQLQAQQWDALTAEAAAAAARRREAHLRHLRSHVLRAMGVTHP